MNRIKDYKKLSEDIVSWIRNYAIENKIDSLVVGVSGGIDSAVVSTLCAMTGLPTYCMILDVFSKESHIELATSHVVRISSLHKNVEGKIKDLSNSYSCFVDDMFGFADELPLANAKSRLRMMALYTVAGCKNGIVVGTGNKVEDFGIGFFTRGGDGCVDISPIADLYKTEVRELGRYLGVSQEIIDSIPTDGLWEDDRSDEDQIGCTYEELEWAMETPENFPILETGINTSSIYYRKIQVLEKFLELRKKNQFKMLPIPIYKLEL